MSSFKLISAIASATTALTFSLPAVSATFDLNWQGQTLGYQAKGQFSYEDNAVPTDGIIRTDDLDTFDIAFFTPEGELLQSFDDNTQTLGFNFNFDTATSEILQTGRWDSPTGLNVGGVRTEELNLFSINDAGAALFDDDAPSPHTHLTD